MLKKLLIHPIRPGSPFSSCWPSVVAALNKPIFAHNAFLFANKANWASLSRFVGHHVLRGFSRLLPRRMDTWHTVKIQDSQTRFSSRLISSGVLHSARPGVGPACMVHSSFGASTSALHAQALAAPTILLLLFSPALQCNSVPF